MSIHIHDNCGKRSGIDRRKLSYFAHIPERRLNGDRRSGYDRRKPMTRPLPSSLERRNCFAEKLPLNGKDPLCQATQTQSNALMAPSKSSSTFQSDWPKGLNDTPMKMATL